MSTPGSSSHLCKTPTPLFKEKSLSWSRKLPGLLGWILFCFSAAATGLFFPPDAWYGELVKPSWNPPNWIFGPVWTALYLMMAVAAWLIWAREGWSGAKAELRGFVVQLILNGLWTPLFFGLHDPGKSLLVILLLWCMIAWTARAFWNRNVVAGLLLIPYLGWVGFATCLNFALWRLNP